MEKKNRCLEILKTLVSNLWYVIVLVSMIAIIFLMIANWGTILHVLERLLSMVFTDLLYNPMIDMFLPIDGIAVALGDFLDPPG